MPIVICNPVVEQSWKVSLFEERVENLLKKCSVKEDYTYRFLESIQKQVSTKRMYTMKQMEAVEKIEGAFRYAWELPPFTPLVPVLVNNPISIGDRYSYFIGIDIAKRCSSLSHLYISGDATT